MVMKSEVVDTRITDRWGVDWTPMEIVRDFLQNFYDDNPVDQIRIDIEGDVVRVSAPKEFDYNELLYLGSDKGEGKIGQYGEGFKAATLNAMRNHHCNVEMLVASQRLEFFFEEKAIGRSKKKVVMCRISRWETTPGTSLILKQCPPELTSEFEFGLSYFYYETNPLFGKELASLYRREIVVYESTVPHGYVFYRNLLRARLDVPLVFICNKSYKSIDDKIRHDRDRKAFNDEVLNKYLKQVCRALAWDQSNIVTVLQPWWAKGHKVLAALADSGGHQKASFLETYFAKSSSRKKHSLDMLGKIEAVEAEFRKKGYLECPGYMAHLGMKTAESVVEEIESGIKKKHQKIHTRPPSELEAQSIEILREFIQAIAPDIADAYASARYIVGDSDEILGELRAARGWGQKEVYLARKVFSLDFGDALSILLHEYAHMFGFDGSRSFSDALTELVAGVVKERERIEESEQKWVKNAAKIRKESGTEVKGVHRYLDRLTAGQKTELLKSLPDDDLMHLLEEKKMV